MALRPVDANSYFILGEDVAEIARTDVERALAIRLFVLADHLDHNRYHRSSLLAIRPLVNDPVALQLLDSNLRSLSGAVSLLPDKATGDERENESILAVAEVLSALRRGDRTAMESNLRKKSVSERIDSLEHVLPGNSEWMLKKVSSARRGKPVLGEDDLMATLRVQAALLGSEVQPWSVDLHSSHGVPMTMIDPVPLVEIFHIDPDRATWRGGRWE